MDQGPGSLNQNLLDNLGTEDDAQDSERRMFAVMHNTVLDHFKEKAQNESDLTEKEQ